MGQSCRRLPVVQFVEARNAALGVPPGKEWEVMAVQLGSDNVVFDQADSDLILAFAGCSLDEKPGKNWVEGVGGLPEY